MSPAIRQIVRVTASRHGSSFREVLSGARYRSIVAARHACIRAVAEARPEFSTTQIARLFGCHHSTIIFALGRLSSKRPTMFPREAA